MNLSCIENDEINYENEKKTTALMHRNFGRGFIGFNSACNGAKKMY